MTAETLPPPLVSTAWLAERLCAPGLVVIDGSWYLPAAQRDPRGEYLREHIPGAVFFDLEAISDQATKLPHMMPDPIAFASAMRKLGVGDGMEIVVYDGGGVFSSPRIWWMLKTFGARDVHVLDGGLPKWKAEGRPVEDGETMRNPAHFTARLDSGAVATLADVRRALESGVQVVDARSAARFRGEAPEPRPGLPSGHMPGALNLPSSELVADGRMRGPDELRAALDAAGVDPDKPLVTSCGSGVSAAIINLSLAMLGKRAPRLYDGSWTEWASTPGAAIEPPPK
ncbi:MAG TPA: 3-mercaptopyruvate sulfurtransferase [Beijerinckiaceae bacterium]|jgi:thiosulfate/3-mercaptopyruvate sulfurtransferase